MDYTVLLLKASQLVLRWNPNPPSGLKALNNSMASRPVDPISLLLASLLTPLQPHKPSSSGPLHVLPLGWSALPFLPLQWLGSQIDAHPWGSPDLWVPSMLFSSRTCIVSSSYHGTRSFNGLASLLTWFLSLPGTLFSLITTGSQHLAYSPTCSKCKLRMCWMIE